ncbi:MAG: hypothetical protein JO061_24445, partial [Acidobacteriaceae bacterium]|nr:hypothetical protein [Acidobacteriaceae bacterium]
MALLLAVFAITFAVAAGSVALGFSYFKRKQKQQIRSMLHTAQGPPIGHRDSSLIKPADPEDPLAKFLRQFQVVDRLKVIFEQAGTQWTASKLLVVSATTTGIGFVLGLKLGSALPGGIGPLAG